MLVLLLGGSAAQANETPEAVVRVNRMEDGIYLSADLHFTLSAQIEEALLKGVPLNFVAEAVLAQDRWYWLDKRVGGVYRNLRLVYSPITGRYRLSTSTTAGGGSTTNGSGLVLTNTYNTVTEALDVIRHIVSWKIANANDVDLSKSYSLEFNFKLDATQLPRPLQIGVLGKSDWNLTINKSIHPKFEVGQ